MTYKKYPGIFRLQNLLNQIKSESVYLDGDYVPARPMGFQSLGSRVHCAWLVFTGRADAVIWPEDEFESASNFAKKAIKVISAQEKRNDP